MGGGPMICPSSPMSQPGGMPSVPHSPMSQPSPVVQPTAMLMCPGGAMDAMDLNVAGPPAPGFPPSSPMQNDTMLLPMMMGQNGAPPLPEATPPVTPMMMGPLQEPQTPSGMLMAPPPTTQSCNNGGLPSGLLPNGPSTAEPGLMMLGATLEPETTAVQNAFGMVPPAPGQEEPGFVAAQDFPSPEQYPSYPSPEQYASYPMSSV